MAKLTQDQIRQLMEKHVSDGIGDPLLMSDPVTMSAIAMAESSGDTDVVNKVPCVGLWQINWPVWKKDDYIKGITKGDMNALKNPDINASAANHVYGLQGYDAWDTYKNGAYKKFLGNNVADRARKGENTAQSLAGGAVDAITPSFQGLVDAITKFSLNAGGALLSLVLIVLGVVILLRNDIGKAVKVVKP
jgi:hypothetical protein